MKTSPLSCSERPESPPGDPARLEARLNPASPERGLSLPSPTLADYETGEFDLDVERMFPPAPPAPVVKSKVTSG